MCTREGFLLAVHVPGGLECCVEVALCANHVTGQTADAVSTSTNGILLNVGDATAIAADTASVTRGTFVTEARWGCEVQSGECRRLAESVSERRPVSKRTIGCVNKTEWTYALGMTARSSKLVARGVKARTEGL